jgi:hypothetical protein
MKTTLFTNAIRAFMLLGAATAFAQGTVEITPEQEDMIFTTLAKTKVAKPPPASFLASVGMDAPQMWNCTKFHLTLPYRRSGVIATQS